MTLPRRQFLHLAACAGALPAASRIAGAQAYPTRPITVVVPFAPGGLADLIGRIVADGMRTSLGQSLIIENVGGAAGSIGAGRVARATPDGYTLVLGIWNTHVANGAIYALQYDIVKDFEPIALLADAPMLLVAHRSVPANDLKEFIAWLKANPRRPAAKGNGHAIWPRGLSRRRHGDTRCCVGADRDDIYQSGDITAARARR
jgi:tripartite-type tricarboxylate transporter receptor subunit TctC